MFVGLVLLVLQSPLPLATPQIVPFQSGISRSTECSTNQKALRARPHNNPMEPSRSPSCAIISPQRAAHLAS